DDNGMLHAIVVHRDIDAVAVELPRRIDRLPVRVVRRRGGKEANGNAVLDQCHAARPEESIGVVEMQLGAGLEEQETCASVKVVETQMEDRRLARASRVVIDHLVDADVLAGKLLKYGAYPGLLLTGVIPEPWSGRIACIQPALACHE